MSDFYSLIIAGIILLLIVLVDVFLFFNALMFILTVVFFRGAYFARAAPKRIKNILELIDKKNAGRVVDLGSGDGELVIALARKGIKTIGYEINPYLVFKSKRRLKKAGLEEWAKIVWKNYWKVDFSGFDTIIVYGIDYMMRKLEKKILKEVKRGTRVISVYFKFPNLKPSRKIADIYLYKIIL